MGIYPTRLRLRLTACFMARLQEAARRRMGPASFTHTHFRRNIIACHSGGSVRLAIVAAFALISLGFSGVTGSAATPPPALPDCQGKLVVKPTSITLACGDGNFYVQNLK